MAKSYAVGPATVPLLGEAIGERLRQTAETHRDAEAVVVRQPQVRATYGELLALVEQAARGFIAIGVQPGDRVGILSANRFEWLVTQYAVALVGGILVPINPHGSSPEVQHVLGDSGVRLLLHAASFRSADLSGLVDDVRSRCPRLQWTVNIDRDWAELLRCSRDVPVSRLASREASVTCIDPAAILYTSGTTGKPKGVTLSHRNILNNGFHVGQRLRYSAADRVCVPVPFFHCFGMVLGSIACIAHGSCIVVPGPTYEPLAVLATIQAEGCTSVYGVPTMYVRQLSQPRLGSFDLTSLRTGIMGGSACSRDLVRRVVTEIGVRELTIAYGMTETSPISIQTGPDDPLEVRATTVGHLLPHLEAQIVHPASGTVMPQGSEGELCIRGYSVMLGYWNDPEATRAAVDEQGWMHTGDLGVMNRDGRFRYTGRIKDIIIVGGENVSSVEVENHLSLHPAIDEVQVIGVHDADYGERVMAWVRLRDGARAEAAELTAFCRRSLAGFKVPAYWRFVDDFPTTASGKVHKAAMREMSMVDLRQTAGGHRHPDGGSRPCRAAKTGRGEA